MIDAGMPPQDVETSTSPSADTSRLIISTLAKATVQTESYATAATTADIDVADTTSTNEEIPGSTSNKASSASSRNQEGPHVPKKKAVRFEPKTRGKIIPRYTTEDIRQVWYSKEEQGQMAESGIRAVTLRRRHSLSEDELNDQHNESIRGLEHCLSKTLLKKCRQEQEDVVDAVLLFQNKMRMEGLPIDHDKLFLASDSLSAPARERAYLKGLEYALRYETRRGTNASS
jgi:endonuclease I